MVLRILFSIFIVAIMVYADGPYCSQSGLGPADMMMNNGAMNPKYMWEKEGGSVHVPVVLDHDYSHKEREVIFGGLAEMASKTCIKFYVYSHPEEVHDGDSVFITKSKGKGCWSYVGKQGGHQDLSLPVGCINHRTVMHEMMHALGFSHEHVRNDRDKFVHIVWDNIQRGREKNFEKKRDSKSDNYGPYDYQSIMHYDNRAFSANGRDTIQPIQGFVGIGRSKRMSPLDALKINRAYKCHHSGKGGFDHADGGPTGFGGFGHSPPVNSPPRFPPPQQSFRPNPFLGGPPPNLNEVDHGDRENSDFLFDSPPFYMEHVDYYHHH